MCVCARDRKILNKNISMYQTSKKKKILTIQNLDKEIEYSSIIGNV